MNGKVNKFLLRGDKFMPEIESRQPRFVYSACRPYTKNKERMQTLKKTKFSRYIFQIIY